MADNSNTKKDLDSLREARYKAEQELHTAKLYSPLDKELIAQKEQAVEEATQALKDYRADIGYGDKDNRGYPSSVPEKKAQPNNKEDTRGFPSSVGTVANNPTNNYDDSGYHTSYDKSKAADNSTQNTQNNQSSQNTQDNQNNQTSTPDAMAGHYTRDPKQSTQNTQDTEEKPADDPGKQKSGFSIDGNSPFWKDVGRALRGAPTGNQYDVLANTRKNQAINSENEAARGDMESQWHRQKADRNVWGEMGKEGSAKNAEEGRQQVQKSNTLGPSSVLQRGNAQGNLQYWQDQSNLHGQQAEQRADAAGNARDAAIQRRGSSQESQIQSRDMNEWNQEAWRLAQGKGGADNSTTPTPHDNPPAEENPPVEENPPAEEPQQPINYDAQHVINGLLGSSQGQDLRNNQGNESDQKMYDWVISQGVKPITPQSNDPNTWENEFLTANGDKGKEIIQMLREGRSPGNAERNFAPNERGQMNNQTQMPGYACGTNNAAPGYAVVGENGPEIIEMKGGEKVYPLDPAQLLSDFRMKIMQRSLKGGSQLSPSEVRWLARRINNGHFSHNDKDYDMFSDDIDDSNEDLMKAYANNIYNYVYNYKSEAQNIDPSIDPEQEHIGPMAQDIEQVNPACVKETPEGVKTVDTARLAMMNAGVIADIARQMQELTEKLKAIGVE